MVFESEGEERVDFGKGIVKGEKVAWGAVGCEGEEVVE